MNVGPFLHEIPDGDSISVTYLRGSLWPLGGRGESPLHVLWVREGVIRQGGRGAWEEVFEVVVVDDIRYFPSLVEEVRYLRSLQDAFDWWQKYLDAPYPVELWLDHDLGDSTVRPFVLAVEEEFFRTEETGYRLPIELVRIISDNPVGRTWIRQALNRWVPVVDGGTPPWRIASGVIV